MSKYPAQIDNGTSLPFAVDNFTPVEAKVFNDARSAILAIETELGVKPGGIYSSVKNRLDTIELSIANFPAVQIGGDLGNTGAQPHVIGIRGNPISATAPNVGDALVFQGTAWVPQAVAGALGPATGDLSGTYPNLKVTKIQGNAVINTLLTINQDGYILTWVNASSQWQVKPAPSGFTAGGDLSGTPTSQTLSKLQGKTLGTSLASVGASQDGYQLTWVNGSSQWQAKPDGVGFTAGGDISGTSSSQQVVGLTGTAGVVSLASGAITLKSPDLITPSGTGAILTIQAQNETGTTSTGGNLVLQSGTGTTTQGSVIIKSGITTSATFTPTGMTVASLQPSGTNTWVLTTVAGVATWSAAGVSGVTQLTGDVTAGPGSGSQAATVVRINGATIGAAGALVTGNAAYVSGISALTYSALNLAGGVGWVSGVLPTGNQAAQSMSGDVTGTTSSNTAISLTGSAGTLVMASTAAILQWAATTTNPTLKMSTHATTPQTLTLKAADVTTGTGSDLALTSGNGSVVAGNVLLQTGATTVATVSPVAVTMASSKYLSFNNSPSLTVGHIRVPNGTVIIGARSSDGLSDTEVLKTFATTVTLGQSTYGSTTVTALDAVRLTSGTNVANSPNADITLQAQTPFASATLTNRDPGNVVINIPSVVAGSTHNGGLTVKYNSTAVSTLGEYNGTGTGTGALWLGANSAATTTTNFALYGAAGLTRLNVETTGTVSLGVNNTSVLSATSTVVTISPLAGSGTGLVGVSNTGALSFTSFASVAGSITLAGDVTGAASSNTVVKINGTTVPAGGALTTGNGLYVTGVGALTYSALNLAGGANYVTGVLPTGNQAAQALGGDLSGTTAAAVVVQATGSAGTLALASTAAIIQWASTTIAPTIKMATHATVPQTLTIQSANVTTGTGSDLVLSTGTGSSVYGSVIAKAGSIEGLRVTSVGATSVNNVVGILGGNNLGTSYCVTGGGYPSFETSNGAIWILPQGTVRTASNLSISADSTSTSFGASSILYFGVGASNKMRMNASTFQFGTNYNAPQYIFDLATAAVFHFGPDALSAAIAYDGVSTATPGATLSITGQNGGTSGVQPGGNVILGSGAGFGGGVAGNVLVKTGGVTALTISPSSAITGDYRTPATWALVAGNGGDRPVLKIDGSNNIIIGATGGVIGVMALRSQSSVDITTSIVNATTAASTSIYVETLALSYTRIWDSAVTSISLSQATHATTQHTFTIQSGNTTTGTGSDLVLQSGTGSVAAGDLIIKSGATTTATFKPAGLILGASLTTHTATATASPYTIDGYATKDYIIFVDTTTAMTINLPAPTAGRILIIKDSTFNAATNNITIARNGSEKIEGVAASRILSSNGMCIVLTSDSVNWFVIN